MSHKPYLDAARSRGLTLHTSKSINNIYPVAVNADQWLAANEICKSLQYRFSALWADEHAERFRVFCCLELEGDYLLLQCAVETEIDSISKIYFAADRPERHTHDLLGVIFLAPFDTRRWTRHKAWHKHQYPLRQDYKHTASSEPLTDNDYPFFKPHGSGVVEIPVGPVHAGIIEPGHFRFQAVGETILNLEQHLGYVHKGIEKIAQGRDIEGLIKLAGRVSGDSTVAHSWAACRALEAALRMKVPERVSWLRAILAERERIANHLGDIGGICNDVGFSFAQSQLTRLREVVLRQNQQYFGHRLLMDKLIVGGINIDISDDIKPLMLKQQRDLRNEFQVVLDLIEDSETLEDRLMTTGRLLPDIAQKISAIGYVGKASGQPVDVRVNSPYSPYDKHSVNLQTYRAGDVAARARIRADEIIDSLRLLGELVSNLPDGETNTNVPDINHACEGTGIIEGWRGEIITYVRIDDAGKVMRFFPRDPSWLNWPALELMMENTIVPDFPVCNKSVNGSYSGQDL